MKKQLKVPIFGGIVLILLILAVFAFISMPKQIEDIKTEENIGKSVKVRGEIKNVLKIGSLSGYVIEDDSGSIAVSSDNLPSEGELITVRGTLIKDSLFGYYIKSN